ncbi:MAG: DUF6714 family protein [Pirellulaceae bacterium]
MLSDVGTKLIYESIRVAFEGVKLENGRSLCEGRAIDDNLSPAEWQLLKRPEPDLDWQNLDAAVLRYHSDALSFLDGKGLRFYLPAFMSLMLDNDCCNDGVPDDLVGTLLHKSTVQTLGPIFTLRQRRCTVEFLSFLLLCREQEIDIFMKESYLAKALVLWLPLYQEDWQSTIKN